jgi:NAD(P)H-nitrite reductase large subunit
VSKFLKRFDPWENIESKRWTCQPRSTSKQGERTVIRLVKQDRKRSLRDLMNEFSQSVPVSICKRSIQRWLSKLWLSQENCCEKTDDFVENRKKSCAMVSK